MTGTKRSRRSAIAPLLLAMPLLTACDAFPLQHSETPCIYPGQTVVLQTQTEPNVRLVYQVHDDFGNTIGPTLFTSTDAEGTGVVRWATPKSLPFTTEIHFILTATSDAETDTRDIHVIEAGTGGRQC